jgi:hypothetical protein
MSTTRLFDVYFALDFSAKSQPGTVRERADALWLAELVIEGEAPVILGERYFRTRHALYTHLHSRLQEHIQQGQRVFLGVDFALGYPQGFANMLGITEEVPAWLGIWQLLSTLIEDYPNNRNNRFAVAAMLNARLNAPTPGPFWGTPISRQTPHFRMTAPSYPFVVSNSQILPRLRYTEQIARSAQETWKLFGAGSVGSQTLLGIPFVHRLMRDPLFAAHTDIFPFTWHFTPPTPRPRPLVIAEIYPTLTPLPLDPTLIKDQSQVRNTVRYFADLDQKGLFSERFAPSSTLSADMWDVCVNEEGWIVGL